eukprot:jgi/Bigna1/80928/fgenesh1_pg.75_\
MPNKTWSHHFVITFLTVAALMSQYHNLEEQPAARNVTTYSSHLSSSVECKHQRSRHSLGNLHERVSTAHTAATSSPEASFRQQHHMLKKDRKRGKKKKRKKKKRVSQKRKAYRSDKLHSQQEQEQQQHQRMRLHRIEQGKVCNNEDDSCKDYSFGEANELLLPKLDHDDDDDDERLIETEAEENAFGGGDKFRGLPPPPPTLGRLKQMLDIEEAVNFSQIDDDDDDDDDDNDDDHDSSNYSKHYKTDATKIFGSEKQMATKAMKSGMPTPTTNLLLSDIGVQGRPPVAHPPPPFRFAPQFLESSTTAFQEDDMVINVKDLEGLLFPEHDNMTLNDRQILARQLMGGLGGGGGDIDKAHLNKLQMESMQSLMKLSKTIINATFQGWHQWHNTSKKFEKNLIRKMMANWGDVGCNEHLKCIVPILKAFSKWSAWVDIVITMHYDESLFMENANMTTSSPKLHSRERRPMMAISTKNNDKVRDKTAAAAAAGSSLEEWWNQNIEDEIHQPEMHIIKPKEIRELARLKRLIFYFDYRSLPLGPQSDDTRNAIRTLTDDLYNQVKHIEQRNLSVNPEILMSLNMLDKRLPLNYSGIQGMENIDDKMKFQSSMLTHGFYKINAWEKEEALLKRMDEEELVNAYGGGGEQEGSLDNDVITYFK